MRVALRLTIAIFAGICVVLVAASIIQARREIELFDRDMRHDDRVLGRTLAVAMESIWWTRGPDAAASLIERAARESTDVTVRWIPRVALAINEPASATEDRIESESSSAARRSEVDERGSGRLLTFVPVVIDGRREGTLELSESLADERAYVRSTIRRTLVAAGGIAVVSGLMAVGLGYFLVGRPIEELAAIARRVGGGDFSQRLGRRGHGEIGVLAREINSMCDQLAEARDRLARETSARVAALEQLRRADRLMTVGKLASGLAHELGTPLNVVSARAKMIELGEAVDDDPEECARVIGEQAARMASIIRQLLDFSRPRTPQKERVELGRLVSATLRMLNPLARARNVSLELDCGAGAVEAAVDAAQLQQVVSNLVMNAIQAMRHGGVVKIRVNRVDVCAPAESATIGGEFAEIAVHDRGEGIAPEDLPHIFEPFFSTKAVGEGTGLGLSVSRGIVREHGGWIDVSSNPEQGTCFSILIPMGESGLPGGANNREGSTAKCERLSTG